jgi:hypothetical protein
MQREKECVSVCVCVCVCARAHAHIVATINLLLYARKSSFMDHSDEYNKTNVYNFLV